MTTLLASRRALLKSTGALVVSFQFAPMLAHAAPVAPLGPKTLDPERIDGYLEFNADGTLTIYCGKVDLGTGLRIAIRQMAAEELGISPDAVRRIKMIEGDTALTPDQGPTAGSTGVMRGGVQIRQAAATARAALIGMAAEKLKVPGASLDLRDGRVMPVSGGGKGIAIAELLGPKRLELKSDAKAPLRDPLTYKVVGKSLPRPDLPAKVSGKHPYVHDFTLPGMLHARVIRPSALDAKLAWVDEASIAFKGVKVVRLNDFLAVVGSDEWTVVKAARDLKAKWEGGGGLPDHAGLYQAIRTAEKERDQDVANKGDKGALQAHASAGGKVLSATYEWPIQSHASMGPSCAVADVKADKATIWTASQATHKFVPAFASLLGLPADKIRMVYLDGAGCYGMNGHDDAAADAALLSKLTGQPVRVQWTREDEHGWDPKGPAQLVDISAGLDAGGKIVAWRTEQWLPIATSGLPNVPLLAPDAARIPQRKGFSAGLLQQNGDPPYAVPNQQVTVHWVKDSPLRSSNIRAPGKIANTFAVEGFTDELAAAAGIDPVEFRLRGLQGDQRAIDVIEHTAKLFGWAARPSPSKAAASGGKARGQGFAYVHYKHAENYVAMAMEVEVDAGTGETRVLRVACGHDCGLIINPDSLKNQIEGSIIQTLSRALHEEVVFDRNRVTSVDWASYRILTMPEVPDIAIDLISRPTEPPFGGGEAAAAPVAAALANAIFDAVGARVRTAPITPDRVKAALKSHGA